MCVLCVSYSVCYIIVSGNEKCSGVVQLPTLVVSIRSESWPFVIFMPKEKKITR